MYPHKFGQGKYFPMFDGLHIEKLLLEIHGQLTAGSGLLWFLNYSKLSITGAGNIALNVRNVTSVYYLIQVCLSAEFKAMMLLLENEEKIIDFKKWMNEKACESPILHYCKMIFDLQVLIFQFVRLERERNYNLYVDL